MTLIKNPIRVSLITTFWVSIAIVTGFCQKAELMFQSGHHQAINWMHYTADGQFLLTADPAEIRIWETENYKLVRQKILNDRNWNDTQLPPQIVRGAYGIIPLYAFADGRRSNYRSANIRSIDFSEALRTVFYQAENTVVSWPIDPDPKVKGFRFSGKKRKPVRSVTSSHSGRIYAFAQKNTILLKNPVNHNTIRKFRFKEEPASLQLSPDEQYLLAIGKRGTLTAWTVQNGKKLDLLLAESSSIRALAFDREGSRIFTLTTQGWLCSTFPEGKPLYRLPPKGTPTTLSPDGRLIYLCEQDKLYTFQVADGVPVGAPKTLPGEVTALALHSEGEQLAVGFADSGHAIVDLRNFNILHQEENRKNIALTLKFSPNERYLASGHSDSTIRIWDLEQGNMSRTLSIPGSIASSMVFSSDEKHLIVGDELGRLHLMDVPAGKTDTMLQAHGQPILKLTFDTTGQRLLSMDPTTLHIWDYSKLKIQKTFNSSLEFRFFDIVNQKNSLLFLESDENKNKMFIQEWDLEKDERLQEESLNFILVQRAAISPDNRYLVLASDEAAWKKNRIVIWDMSLQKAVITLFNLDALEVLMFSPDGEKLFVAGRNHRFRMFDWKVIEALDSVKSHDPLDQLASFYGHYESIQAAAFSPSGDYFVSAANDQQLIIWDLKSNRASLVLTTFDEPEAWIVKDSIGQFDGSRQAFDHLHYAVENELIHFDQLKERYYKPKLLAMNLKHDAPDGLPATSFQDIPLYPKSSLILNGKTLEVKLHARSGGIGKVGIFVGNKEIIADANPDRLDTFAIDLSAYAQYFGEAQTYQIGVQCWNQDQLLSSRITTIPYQHEPTISLSSLDPHAYLIAIGSSDYKGEAIDLDFAAKDAYYIMRTLTASARRLLGNDRVHSYLFSSDVPKADSEHLYASKNNIKTIFQELSRKVHPEDVLVLYLSGHGTTFTADNQDLFYYLTPDIGSTDVKDRAVREAFAISTEEFSNWLNAIPSRKMVLILDACASGTFADDLSRAQSMPKGSTPSQIRAIDRLKDRTGVFVLSGSTANKDSYEASRFGQGLLTYSLLLGIKGGEGLRSREFIDVLNLFSFAKEKVPVLASQIGGIQDPMIFFPYKSESYDIGQVSEQIRKGIEIAQPKPFFTRARLHEKDDFFDPLGLEAFINSQLEDFNHLGPDAPLIFIDEIEGLTAYLIGGAYEIQDQMIKIQCRVSYDKQTQGDTFTVSGSLEDLEGLAKRIIKEAYNQIK